MPPARHARAAATHRSQNGIDQQGLNQMRISLAIAFTAALGSAIAASGGALAQQPAHTAADAKLIEACLSEVERTDGNDGTSDTARDCVGLVAEACQAAAPENQTTIGMTGCMLRETDFWDADLNASYAHLEDRLEPKAFDALRTAQRNWIAFRDADCTFQYTHWQGGTIRAIYGASCRLDHTAARALGLRGYLGWTDR